MRMKIVKWVALVLVSALALSLMACNNAPYADPEVPKDYVVDPSGRIKVSMYLRSGEQSEIALDKWIKVYNENYPNVKVRRDIIEWAQFPVQVAAGDIGDVYYTSDLDVYNYAVRYKGAMPLDAYVDNLGVDVQSIYTNVYDLGCYNGRLYMVPSDISQSTFLINVSALREAGLKVPAMTWTWDEFYNDYCPALRKVASDGTYEQVGIYIQTDDEVPALTYFLEGWGGKWCDTVNKKTHFYSDEKVLEGIWHVIDLIDKGYASTRNLRGEIGALHANLQDPQGYGFKYALHSGILWQDRIANMETYNAVGLEMDVVTVPETPNRVIPGDTFGYVVYSKTRNPDAAATFVLTLCTFEGQDAFNSVVGGGIPTRRDVAEKGNWKLPFDEDKFNYDAFTAYPESFVACWTACSVPPEVGEIITKYLNNLVANHFNNVKSYQDTLSTMEQEANEKWATLFEEG